MKSSLDVKDEHIPDVAVQMHVVRRAGLAVKRGEIMHLNRECRYPDLSDNPVWHCNACSTEWGRLGDAGVHSSCSLELRVDDENG